MPSRVSEAESLGTRQAADGTHPSGGFSGVGLWAEAQLEQLALHSKAPDEVILAWASGPAGIRVAAGHFSCRACLVDALHLC